MVGVVVGGVMEGEDGGCVCEWVQLNSLGLSSLQ